MDALWSIRVSDGPVYWGVFAASGALILYLALRRPTARWVTTALLGVLGGGVVGGLLFYGVNAVDAFGSPLPHPVGLWVVATFAAIGLAIVNLWRSRWWRKVIAAVAIVVFAVAGGLGINAYYGLDPTLGSLFGVSTTGRIVIPGGSGDDSTVPVYKTWKAPPGMPSKGRQGTQVIPATVNCPTRRPWYSMTKGSMRPEFASERRCRTICR